MKTDPEPKHYIYASFKLGMSELMLCFHRGERPKLLARMLRNGWIMHSIEQIPQTYFFKIVMHKEKKDGNTTPKSS